jgi:hypothetical protein
MKKIGKKKTCSGYCFELAHTTPLYKEPEGINYAS